jgi:hypothetical protein
MAHFLMGRLAREGKKDGILSSELDEGSRQGRAAPASRKNTTTDEKNHITV